MNLWLILSSNNQFNLTQPLLVRTTNGLWRFAAAVTPLFMKMDLTVRKILILINDW